VLDSLRSARQALQADSYEGVVKSAIAFGLDTDTTACIAGGIAGLKVGASGLPARWCAAMRGKELVRPLLRDLLRHHDLEN